MEKQKYFLDLRWVMYSLYLEKLLLIRTVRLPLVKIQHVLNESEDSEEDVHLFRIMLELKNIIKTYHVGTEDIQVLKDVDVTIQDGEFVAIMGPSGSGKSTLMNIIGLLDKPTSGSYFLDGKNTLLLTDNEEAEFRGKKIGFIFQGYNLIPRLSALEQVMLPLDYQ
jgi:ABC-type transporter Mla maintaining outer membrane lipid asymmetry ATPase subunit MlaF